MDGHISQIPGLSPTISAVSLERTRGRRAGVLESDSDYVKLAKQGGHKGLLWHEETVSSKPNSYQPPDWFFTASLDSSKPRHHLSNSEKKRNPGAFQPLEPPFGTDSMLAWERGDSNSNSKKENNNIHCSEMEKLQSPNPSHETSNFKRIMSDKKPAPIDMSKLLSFGYAEDNKPIPNTDVSN